MNATAKEYREDWMTVSRQEWDGRQDSIRKAIAAMEWRALPVQDAPAMPGLAIKACIEEFRIPRVSRVAWSHALAPYGLCGIEGTYKNGLAQVYVLDLGSHVSPLVVYFWPKE